jgi:hypothetical protein
MLRDKTRATLIQGWLFVATLVAVTALAFGVTMTVGTALMLFVLSLVPPVIVFMLWPAVQPVTVAEVLRGADRRD